jgi:hypothetical protein
MASNVTIDGTTYSIPDPRDKNYVAGSTGLTAYLKKIATAFSVRPSQKVYDIGVTYPNGTPTITGVDTASASGTIFLSQSSNGTWVMNYFLSGVKTALSTSTAFTLSGITSSNVSRQSYSASALDSVAPAQITVTRNILEALSGDFSIGAVADFDTWWLNGFAVLDSKPTWAD